MAMAVVLFPASDEGLELRPSALEALADLGVTSIALVRDESTAGLVLEGWAFDPADARRAACAVTGACRGVSTLQPLVQMAVSTAATNGGIR
jgi:hypothetical protein